MSRVQKKCLIGSVGLHLLLVVTLLIGPEIFAARRPPDSTILEVVPDRVTDGITQGGNRNAQPPAPAPPAPPIIQQQTPAPPPPKPLVDPEPPKTSRNPDVTEPPRHHIDVST